MRKAISFFRATFLWVLILPYIATFIGAASNQLVLIANHDKFPVMLNAAKMAKLDASDMIDDIHCLMTHDTHLNALADIFDLRDAVYSIGDFMLILGDWLGSFCFFVWAALLIKKVSDTRLSTM